MPTLEKKHQKNVKRTREEKSNQVFDGCSLTSEIQFIDQTKLPVFRIFNKLIGIVLILQDSITAHHDRDGISVILTTKSNLIVFRTYKMRKLSIVLLAFIPLSLLAEDEFIGCYKEIPSAPSHNIPSYKSVDECLKECKIRYYRYSLIKGEGYCICTNYLGEMMNATTKCAEYCNFCEYKANLTDAYSTGNILPGPPREIQLTNITDSSVHISWKKPDSYTEITEYRIRAIVVQTYSSYKLRTLVWSFSNDTLRTELSSLQPATKYNLTLCAISPEGIGPEVSQPLNTRVGNPDNLPDPPKIVKNSGNTLEVSFTPTMNNNGPVTSYLVVVVNQDANQIFQEEFLKSYDESRRDGINYYITAEINPQDIERNFVIGDGRYYKRYQNAPLNPNTHYKVLLGITSQLGGITKRAFSSELAPPIRDVLDLEEEVADSPGVIIGLSVGIVLLGLILIAGIIGFIYLKYKLTRRRQYLSDNQELSLQGPMIEVENNGYIPEEEHTVNKASHYRNLKQKLRNIPYSQLKIEPSSLLGIGKFGRVNSGSIYEDNTLIPVAAYSIQDKKLNQEDKKNMLLDLDVLIRTGKHDNVVSLLGTCETSHMLFVVLEYISMNLKDLLLGSRDSLPGRFSNMSETQALDIAVGIARGLAHLEANKIVHKQICARSVLVSNGFVPKIGAYGLSQYFSHNNLPDYTRWTALEVFKGNPHSHKSDAWSFACLLWEICVLGGTPYGNFSNNEIPGRVIKGLRLPQMQYFSDDLYQIMLNCWQIDMSERPDFEELIESLSSLKENTFVPYLNFNLYPSFQYEQFYPDMEIAVRPVF